MKFLLKTFLSLVLIFNVSVVTNGRDNLSSYFQLIPLPQKIELISASEGISFLTLKAICLQGYALRPVMYGPLKPLSINNKSGKGILTLNISTGNNLPDSDEGYVLEIKDGQVTISARAQAGLFYGCQTLLQLLEDSRDQQVEIPACRITDYPKIAYRGIHLDLRHHVNSIGYYYKMIDRLAHIKVNAVIIEFQDRLRYRKVSIVGAIDAIPIEQFAALSDYARERNIDVSPLVQGLGHAEHILKHKEYKHLREDPTSDWAFSPLNPETYDLQFSLYKDAIAATPGGKYLHVGGDEVVGLGASALSKQSGMNPFELQMYWLNKVSTFVKQHNRIPIFWDDMVFKATGLYQTTWNPKMSEQDIKTIWYNNKYKLDGNVELFPENVVYMRWNYSDPQVLGTSLAIDWYNSNNLSVMPATASQTIWPLLPRNHSNFQPIKDFCKIAVDKKLNGILCTEWDNCSIHFDETFWRGRYFFSMFSWNYKDITFNQAKIMFRHRFYGPQLSDSSFEFQDIMEQSLDFWEEALVEKGGRITYPGAHKKYISTSFDLIDLPDPLNIGTWSEKYKKKINDAKEAIKQYDIIKSRLENSIKASNRNRYSLSLLNEINEVQIYPAKLLLLLNKYDQATLGNKKIVIRQIQECINDFVETRKDFEKVFSVERIMIDPCDNCHIDHAPNKIVNTDWIYLFEIAMNNKISEWIKTK